MSGDDEGGDTVKKDGDKSGGIVIGGSERSSMEGKILESNPIASGSGGLFKTGLMVPETSQASLQSPYHQENFFTKDFDERPMEDVIEEIKSSS